MTKNNTVYILGAGFSYPAKIPLQSKLLREILSYEADFNEPQILNAQNELKNFISTFWDSPENLSLEDICTILDRSIIEKERFKHFTWQDIYTLREQLVYLILFVINKKSSNLSEKVISIYKDFSKKNINTKVLPGGNSDNISIISLNWDTILEQHLANFQDKNIRIDYGTSTLEDRNKPHITKKSSGKYNIKILKLHGSLNWLFCSNCGRLFVNIQPAVGVEKPECKFCKEDKIEKEERPTLEYLVITPTFLKELTNLHLKNIWQNAFIELQKASKVTFIGYSLPYADFELKYLFKKAIKPKTKIGVVLIKDDKTNGTKDRYESFFGKDINFDFRGLKGWLKKNMQ